ncbi:hypothetical protein Cus16_3200 [Curtobacterium sp. ER1/6]|nr:hypothetical protein Cus16_3200 [Curtobacterium sp. ER1/6]
MPAGTAPPVRRLVALAAGRRRPSLAQADSFALSGPRNRPQSRGSRSASARERVEVERRALVQVLVVAEDLDALVAPDERLHADAEPGGDVADQVVARDRVGPRCARAGLRGDRSGGVRAGAPVHRVHVRLPRGHRPPDRCDREHLVRTDLDRDVRLAGLRGRGDHEGDEPGRVDAGPVERHRLRQGRRGRAAEDVVADAAVGQAVADLPLALEEADVDRHGQCRRHAGVLRREGVVPVRDDAVVEVDAALRRGDVALGQDGARRDGREHGVGHGGLGGDRGRSARGGRRFEEVTLRRRVGRG